MWIHSKFYACTIVVRKASKGVSEGVASVGMCRECRASVGETIKGFLVAAIPL